MRSAIRARETGIAFVPATDPRRARDYGRSPWSCSQELLEISQANRPSHLRSGRFRV
jgi:hypothetical protein